MGRPRRGDRLSQAGAQAGGQLLKASDRAFELVNGFRASQIVHAAVALHIPDLLADGPLPAADVAERTGLDPDRARRLLRGLTALGVVVEVEGGRYGNTEVGDVFREGVSGSRRALAMMHIPQSYRAWEHFLETLRTGTTGHSLAYGRTLWDTIAADPEFATRFNESMAANSRAAGMFVALAGNFAGAVTVVDVGGGKGALLAAVLREHPRARGIVCDLAAGLTEARAYLAEQGVLDRCEIVEADFFKAVPGGDVYLLKDILHDWDDADAVRILAACRAAMHAQGRVLIVERVLPERFDADPAKLNAVMTDLHMMVLFGGRERTPDEYQKLFSAAGLRLTRVERSDPYGVVEASPS